MAVIAAFGAGVMASALTNPARDNGHEVRLIGTHLDDEIIDSVKTTGVHPNLNVILETLTANGRCFAMAQKFIPEISSGDKRILMIDGEPVPYALARVPQGDEFRGNLAAGGKGVGVPLSERDRWIAAEVGPELKRRGMLFVGLDVIGDWLTEVNVTSPTCLRELDAQFGLNIAGQLFDVIESRLKNAVHEVHAR